MKRSILTLLTIVTVISTKAQGVGGGDSAYFVNGFAPTYTIKWNPSSIAFGKISLFGEYNFKPRRSITFNAGIPVEVSTTRRIEDEMRTITMKSYSAMAGYRMYLGSGVGKGLYFEPYLKYMGSKGSFPYVDTESIDSTTYFLSSNYRGAGVGAQLGVQFLIAKKLTLDFFFLGPEANLSKWDIDLQEKGNYTWDSQDAAEALDILNDIVDDLPDFISDNVKTSVNADAKTVSAKYNGFIPGFRFGLSVGWRF